MDMNEFSWHAVNINCGLDIVVKYNLGSKESAICRRTIEHIDRIYNIKNMPLAFTCLQVLSLMTFSTRSNFSHASLLGRKQPYLQISSHNQTIFGNCRNQVHFFSNFFGNDTDRKNTHGLHLRKEHLPWKQDPSAMYW